MEWDGAKEQGVKGAMLGQCYAFPGMPFAAAVCLDLWALLIFWILTPSVTPNLGRAVKAAFCLGAQHMDFAKKKEEELSLWQWCVLFFQMKWTESCRNYSHSNLGIREQRQRQEKKVLNWNAKKCTEKILKLTEKAKIPWDNMKCREMDWSLLNLSILKS